jgi:uncharacterized protein YecE (DUF72 family)
MSDRDHLADVFIGTSGWSYPHWADVFYPPGVKPGKYLEHYVSQFNCVEINASFYHLPREATIEGWMVRTPEAFRFCPKLSRYITHQVRLHQVGESLAKFFALFRPMEKRMGPVLIQLPPGIHFDLPLLTNFLSELAAYNPPFRFALEIRHRSWLNDLCFDLLKKYGVAFVVADSGARFPYCEAITTDFMYLRLHGHETLYASEYTASELQQFAGKIAEWRLRMRNIWVFFNNDFHGFAVKNALRLREMVQT